MPKETERTTGIKRIKLPSGDIVKVPCITKISFVDASDRNWETQHTIDNSEESGRTVHVDKVYHTDVDKDGKPTEENASQDTSESLSVERIDLWPFVDANDRNQETQTTIDNKEGADSKPPKFTQHERTHVYRYYEDPQNIDDDGVWIDSELIDEFVFDDGSDRNQETRYTLTNPTNEETRDGDLWGQASEDDPDITIGEGEGEGTEEQPVRLDPFQNIVNFAGGYWLEVKVYDIGQPEIDSEDPDRVNGSTPEARICMGNGSSGEKADLSKAIPKNGTKLVGEDDEEKETLEGQITYPTTWVWHPKESVIPLGPGIFVNNGCGDGSGGFAVTWDACGGTQSVSPCTGPAQIVGIDSAFDPNATEVYKAIGGHLNSEARKPGVYFDMTEAEFTATPIAVPVPVRAADSAPGQTGDKFSPVSAQEWSTQLNQYRGFGGSTLFYTPCSCPGPPCGPCSCGAPMAAGLLPAGHHDVATAGYNHDDIYVFTSFPVNKGVAEEDEKEAVQIKFTQSQSEWQEHQPSPSNPTTIIEATLYAKSDWKVNDDFEHEVEEQTLTFNIEPPLKKKDKDSDDELTKKQETFSVVGPKSYDITVIKKDNDEWEIKIEES